MQHRPVPAVVQASQDDPLISTSEAALILGVTGRSVRNFIKRRELIAYRVGHDYRVRASVIAAYLATHCNATE